MLHRIAEAAGSRYSGTREVIKDGRKASLFGWSAVEADRN